MAAQQLIEEFRAKKYVFHAILACDERKKYLETCKDIDIKLRFNCQLQDGTHKHTHYLLSTNVSPDALHKRFQRASVGAEKKNNYVKRVSCEQYLLGCLHYFHCQRGQKNHVHDMATAFNIPEYRHAKNECTITKEKLRKDTVIEHSPECPCFQQKERYFEKIKKWRQNRVNRWGGAPSISKKYEQ